MARIFSAVLALAIVTGMGLLLVNGTNATYSASRSVSAPAAPAPAL
jgi:hypothetical protein